MEVAEQSLGPPDVGEIDADGLRAVLLRLRRLEALLDAWITSVGVRADELAAAGLSAPADEFLLGCGEVAGTTARAEARRAALAARSADIKAGVTSGRLSGDAVAALERRVRPLSDDELNDVGIDGAMADAARLPVDTFDVGLRRTIDGLSPIDVEADTDRSERLRAASELTHWFDETTRLGHLHAVLDPERYEAVTGSIDRHAERLAAADSSGEVVEKGPNLAAEALHQLVVGRSGGDGGGPAGPAAAVTVVVDAETLFGGRHRNTLARTADGYDLSTDAVARLCCDATLRRVVHDERGVPLDVGRRSRTATSAQRAAIGAMYSTCAWPHCRLPLRWTQIHHIREWENGGPTDLANLLPLCHRHHHRVHEGRWSIVLASDRTVHTYLPNGMLHASRAPDRRCPDGSSARDEAA